MSIIFTIPGKSLQNVIIYGIRYACPGSIIRSVNFRQSLSHMDLHVLQYDGLRSYGDVCHQDQGQGQERNHWEVSLQRHCPWWLHRIWYPHLKLLQWRHWLSHWNKVSTYTHFPYSFWHERHWGVSHAGPTLGNLPGWPTFFVTTGRSAARQSECITGRLDGATDHFTDSGDVILPPLPVSRRTHIYSSSSMSIPSTLTHDWVYVSIFSELSSFWESVGRRTTQSISLRVSIL